MKKTEKVLLGCLFLAIMAVFAGLMARSPELDKYEPMYGPPVFPMEVAEKLSVDQLAESADAASVSEPGAELLLPTWMPGDIKLRQIYFMDMAMLVFSDCEVTDYREDNITIEIKRMSVVPSREDIKRSAGEDIMEIGDILVQIPDDPEPGPSWKERGLSPIIAFFYYKGFYYFITAVEGQVTRDDVVQIIKNMEPVGQRTLRII